MIIKNITKKTCLSDNCDIAERFDKRFMGLMGKSGLPAGGGLFITPCNSIHMFFMRFSLDIVFVDRDNTVVYQIENIKPWSLSPIVRKATSTIELPVGTIKNSGTKPGDKLLMEK